METVVLREKEGEDVSRVVKKKIIRQETVEMTETAEIAETEETTETAGTGNDVETVVLREDREDAERIVTPFRLLW